MRYICTLGDPESDICKVIQRDSLNECLHWLGDQWPISAHDSSACVFVELDTGTHLRVLQIAQEGVAEIAEIRKAIRLMTTTIDAVVMP